MATRQNTQPNSTLMARLHAACRASQNRSALGLRGAGSGDYLVELPEQAPKRSTLGSSINYHPANA